MFSLKDNAKTESQKSNSHGSILGSIAMKELDILHMLSGGRGLAHTRAGTSQSEGLPMKYKYSRYFCI